MKLAATAGQKAVCMICGEDARFRFPAAVGTEVVCESPDCRAVLSRRKHVGPHEFGFLIERRRRQNRERARLAERSAREALENESIRVAVVGQESLPSSRFPLVVLPAASQVLEEPSLDRRHRYREHVVGIIAAAFADGGDVTAPTHDESSPADPVPLAERFCALCRGGCCSMGGESAYLNVATIRRLMRLRPDLSPDRMSAEYLDRVRMKTVAGSCINHTPTGCGLPRELRSETCNAFYCKELRDWQARIASGETPLGAVVVQRGEDNWSRDRSDVAHDVVGVSIVTDSGARSLAR
jgi:hypothetical protein